jgi:hypothetical protein
MPILAVYAEGHRDPRPMGTAVLEGSMTACGPLSGFGALRMTGKLIRWLVNEILL